MFDDIELAYLRSQRLARLATVDGEGQPDNVPVAFAFDGARFLIGGFHLTTTRKYRNVAAGRRRVALTIDDLESVDPWRPRGIRVYGRADVVEEDGPFGFGTYLAVTPRISWSWALQTPFDPPAGGPPGANRTVW